MVPCGGSLVVLAFTRCYRIQNKNTLQVVIFMRLNSAGSSPPTTLTSVPKTT